MSDIAVRKLAETMKAPVGVLLRQLQDAGIRVSGPDDMITDQQRKLLLDKISSSSNQPANQNKGSSKIMLKRPHADQGHAGQNRPGKVNVEVKRKKVLTRQASAEETAANREQANRAEEVARKVGADRKAREEIIAKAEQERRTLEARRIAAKAGEADARNAQAAGSNKAVAGGQSAAGVATNTKTISMASVAEATKKTASTEPVVSKAVPASVVVRPDVLPSSVTPNSAKTTTVVTTEPSSIAPALVSAPESLATPSSETDDQGSGNLREQRDVVVAAARQEAEAALKRRPSRPKHRPKASLAPKTTFEVETPEVEVVPTSVVSVLVKDDEHADKKRGEKKVQRSKPRERDREEAGGGNAGRNNKLRKGGGRKGQYVEATKADAKHGFERPTAPVVRDIEIPLTIVVSDLAQKLAIRATDIIKAMMKMGMMVTINQSIDQDTAILVTEELGHTAKAMVEVNDEAMLASAMTDTSGFEQHVRPPVVTIMGHVDHGKTSLLDYIRQARVAAGEAGGITQHIGAYHVDTDHGTVTFLDTPGHAAFTKMRARGAQVTDIVVLIVAADDGVMPQTKEAIDHARAANVPIVVAINKIDKPTADPERVLSELAQYNVLTEAWGGDVPVVKVSAKTGVGIDELLETLLLVAEVGELRASTDMPAKGHVIEASMERGRGAVATVLVREGTLCKGDILLCGSEYGRVRAMFDERGRSVKEAGPSIPVAVLGLTGAPQAGDEAIVLNDERRAREIAEMRKEKQRDTRFAEQQSSKLDNLFNQMGSEQRLNLIVKADVQGSVEAIRSEMLKLSTSEIEVRVISSGIGGMTEGDIDLAAASKAIILAFNVRAGAAVRKAAEDNGVEIRYYSIIYDVINDVKDAMSGMLSPETREVFVGLAEVREVFRASTFGQVAGCLVVDGLVRRGNPIRILRDNVVIFTGELESLRRHRDDVKEVHMGTECGIAVKDYSDVRVGDQIEVFEKIEVARKIT